MPPKPEPIPSRARADLAAALSLLTKTSGVRALHYLLAVGPDKRDGDEEALRLVLVTARDGALVKDTVFFRLYGTDPAIDAAKRQQYQFSRGVVVVAEGEVTLFPSNRQNVDRAEGALRARLRQLDRAMAPVFPHPGFKVLLKAKIAAAEDPAEVVARYAASGEHVGDDGAGPGVASTSGTDLSSALAALAAWQDYARDLPETVEAVYGMLPADEATMGEVRKILQRTLADLDAREHRLLTAVDALDDVAEDEAARVVQRLGRAIGEIQSFEIELDGVLDDLQGVKAPAEGTRLSPAWTDAVARYRDAQEAVDRQIAALQRKLRESDDADLKRIAELGLNAVSGNHRSPMQAAILDLTRTGSDGLAKAIDTARAAILAFTDHLETSEVVEACDENPFEVDVKIRATLLPALKGLVAATVAV